MKTKYVFLIIGGLFLWMILMFNMCSSEDYGSSVSNYDKTEYNQKHDAPLNARGFVKQRLKSPSTAKFPPTNTATVSKTPNGTYIVSSYVDSQNGFGATIRTNWVAEIEYLPGGKVKLIDIAFIE